MAQPGNSEQAGQGGQQGVFTALLQISVLFTRQSDRSLSFPNKNKMAFDFIDFIVAFTSWIRIIYH